MTSSNNCHQQLFDLVQQGKRPVVRFTKAVLDAECYAEPGMMARVIGVSLQHDDVLKLDVDYGEFEAHNKALESANYYDKEGKPTWTARQAGYYKPIDWLYVDAGGSGPSFAEIMPDAASALYDRFRAETGAKGDVPYVSWLEQAVLAAEAKLEEAPSAGSRLKP
jgi:hypothetical protein